jgi:hypothetical protein
VEQETKVFNAVNCAQAPTSRAPAQLLGTKTFRLCLGRSSAVFWRCSAIKDLEGFSVLPPALRRGNMAPERNYVQECHFSSALYAAAWVRGAAAQEKDFQRRSMALWRELVSGRIDL